MKNLNESFDAELTKRLRDYSEEPRIQLWQNIKAMAEANRRPDALRKRTRTGWILILFMASITGLYYFEQTSADFTKASRSESSVQNINENEKEVENVRAPGMQKNRVSALAHKDDGERVNRVVKSSANSEQTLDNEKMVSAVVQKPDISSADVDTGLSHDGRVSQKQENVVVEKNDVIGGKEDPSIVIAARTNNADEVKTVIPEKKKSPNKFGIYFTIMPTFGYQRINSNSTDDIIIEGIKKISAFSTDRLGVRAELGVETSVAKRFKVFSGLVYYQRKQTIDYTEKQVEYTEVSEGPDGDVILVPAYKYVERSFEYELKNLGLQVGVSYELSRKILLQTLGTGFEFHVALNKLNSSPTAPEFTNNPSAYVFYNLYYRMQYPAEGRLKAVFQPTLNYSFYINQNVNAPFYVKPYGLGLNLGLTYNF